MDLYTHAIHLILTGSAILADTGSMKHEQDLPILP